MRTTALLRPFWRSAASKARRVFLDDIHGVSKVPLGVVATHAGIGCLLPDDKGNLPVSPSGELSVVRAIRDLVEATRVPLDRVQVPCFPGTCADQQDAVVHGLTSLGLQVEPVLMVGSGDPMAASDLSLIHI